MGQYPPICRSCQVFTVYNPYAFDSDSEWYCPICNNTDFYSFQMPKLDLTVDEAKAYRNNLKVQQFIKGMA